MQVIDPLLLRRGSGKAEAHAWLHEGCGCARHGQVVGLLRVGNRDTFRKFLNRVICAQVVAHGRHELDVSDGAEVLGVSRDSILRHATLWQLQADLVFDGDAVALTSTKSISFGTLLGYHRRLDKAKEAMLLVVHLVLKPRTNHPPIIDIHGDRRESINTLPRSPYFARFRLRGGCTVNFNLLFISFVLDFLTVLVGHVVLVAVVAGSLIPVRSVESGPELGLEPDGSHARPKTCKQALRLAGNDGAGVDIASQLVLEGRVTFRHVLNLKERISKTAPLLLRGRLRLEDDLDVSHVRLVPVNDNLLSRVWLEAL